MVVLENKTVYKCDFCKKKLFVKGAMERHEHWCSGNPKNVPACSGCEHLTEVEVEYEGYGFDGDGRGVKQAKGFLCTKLNKKLFPTIVLRKGLTEKYPETFEDQELMPTKCEHHSIVDLLKDFSMPNPFTY